jgi:hypothetical protein
MEVFCALPDVLLDVVSLDDVSLNDASFSDDDILLGNVGLLGVEDVLFGRDTARVGSKM